VDADIALGDLAAAERRAREIASQHPRRGLGPALLGDVARARGQAPAAVEAYQRAQRLEPDSAGALRLFRAQAGLDAGAAVQTARQWLAGQPRDAAVRQALADFHASRGQWAEARTQYEALIQQVPAHAEALNNLAHVLLALRDLPAASRTAEAALAARPDAAHVLGTAGWVAWQAGQRDRALQLLREARLRDPANPDTRFYLATALAGAGRSGEARDELHAALQAGTYFANQLEAQSLLQTLR
jgi:predicted Zn-dependent protease